MCVCVCVCVWFCAGDDGGDLTIGDLPAVQHSPEAAVSPAIAVVAPPAHGDTRDPDSGMEEDECHTLVVGSPPAHRQPRLPIPDGVTDCAPLPPVVDSTSTPPFAAATPRVEEECWPSAPRQDSTPPSACTLPAEGGALATVVKGLEAGPLVPASAPEAGIEATDARAVVDPGPPLRSHPSAVTFSNLPSSRSSSSSPRGVHRHGSTDSRQESHRSRGNRASAGMAGINRSGDYKVTPAGSRGGGSRGRGGNQPSGKKERRESIVSCRDGWRGVHDEEDDWGWGSGCTLFHCVACCLLPPHAETFGWQRSGREAGSRLDRRQHGFGKGQSVSHTTPSPLPAPTSHERLCHAKSLHPPLHA